MTAESTGAKEARNLRVLRGIGAFLRRRWRIIVLLGGLSLMGLIIANVGPGKLLRTFETLGWAILLLIVFPAVLQQIGFIVGWWLAFPPKDRPPIHTLVLPHIAGEAANVITGSADIGGEPIRAALVAPREGVAVAGASALEARTFRIVAQLIFVTGGLIAGLIAHKLPRLVELSLLIGLPILAVGVGAFVWLQQRRLLARSVDVFRNVMKKFHVPVAEHYRDSAASIDRRLEKSYERNKLSAAISVVVQVAAWAVMGGEPYLVAHFLGKHLTLANGVLLEALSLGMATVFFVIPLGLGITDVARALLFDAFGLTPAVGITWSIVRRVSELSWAATGVVVLNRLKKKSR